MSPLELKQKLAEHRMLEERRRAEGKKLSALSCRVLKAAGVDADEGGGANSVSEAVEHAVREYFRFSENPNKRVEELYQEWCSLRAKIKDETAPALQASLDELIAAINDLGESFKQTIFDEYHRLLDDAAGLILPYCSDMDEARQLVFHATAIAELEELSRAWRYSPKDPAMTAAQLLGAMSTFTARTNKRQVLPSTDKPASKKKGN